MDNIVRVVLWTLVAADFLSYTKGNNDDSELLESILAAPRARNNNKHLYTYNKETEKRLEQLDEYLMQKDELNLLLRRFANSYIRRNRFPSHKKRNGWFTDDPGNRATDTPLTTPPSTTIPTTLTTTTAPDRSNGSPNIPNKPSWWPPSWGWPWGKRRRRRFVSNRA